MKEEITQACQIFFFFFLNKGVVLIFEVQLAEF